MGSGNAPQTGRSALRWKWAREAKLSNSSWKGFGEPHALGVDQSAEGVDEGNEQQRVGFDAGPHARQRKENRGRHATSPSRPPTDVQYLAWIEPVAPDFAQIVSGAYFDQFESKAGLA